MTDNPQTKPLPVIVIGAGPVGLAAAAHLAERSVPFTVLEAGDRAGAAVREWNHVALFSPWQYNTDSAARRLLEASGWVAPDQEALPTGRELVERYLQPLAELPALAPHIRFGARVSAIARYGIDRIRTEGRERVPFVVRLADGEDVLGRAVIDASGTWGHPNVLGGNGLPARGESAAAAWIEQAMPDVLGADRARFAGRHTAVVGAGHSAATSLLALAELAAQQPGTKISWVIRGKDAAGSYSGADDELPARGALGAGLRPLIDTGRVDLVPEFRTQAVRLLADGPETSQVELAAADDQGFERTVVVDRIIAATGYRPDHTISGELRLELDPILEAPRVLAPLIDPNMHSCGTVSAHGVDELAHPEPGYFLVGMKSYGRAPTFLMATGFEQVRSIVAALAGDWEAAREVHLELPETGVCSAISGGAALADRLGLSSEEHDRLLAVTAKYLPRSRSAGDAVLAAAKELGIDETAALQLAAYASDLFDVSAAPVGATQLNVTESRSGCC
jgi:cation diffusion facilitator CzcD-associated flavoprotein CzcO